MQQLEADEKTNDSEYIHQARMQLRFDGFVADAELYQAAYGFVLDGIGFMLKEMDIIDGITEND